MAIIRRSCRASFGLPAPRWLLELGAFFMRTGTERVIKSRRPAFVSKPGSTMTGTLTLAPPAELNFGAGPRQMINLWNSNYGIGIQDFTLYQRSGGGFTWFGQGNHNDNANNSGAGGKNLMWLNSIGDLFANASVTVDVTGANAGTIHPGLIFGFGSGEGIASVRAAGTATSTALIKG